MSLELKGNKEEAHALFQLAWEMAAIPFESFIAAHYLARNQTNPQENLRWNLEALKQADAVAEATMQSHYPSLYLNIARSYENLENISEAARYYHMAAEKSSFLPPGSYGDVIKSGIRQGLKRTTKNDSQLKGLDELIDAWCERRELKALSFALPAYISNSGSELDTNRLLSALNYLIASGTLNDKEKEKLISVVNSLTVLQA
jgi:hypothetical protein